MRSKMAIEEGDQVDLAVLPLQVPRFGPGSPARVWKNGADQIHRADGPAIEWADGSKMWVLGGHPHRVGRPAHERANGYQEWWIHGRQQKAP